MCAPARRYSRLSRSGAVLLRALQHKRSTGRPANRHLRTRKHPADRSGDADSLRIGRTIDVSRHRNARSGPGISEWHPVSDSQHDAAGFAVLAGRAACRALFPPRPCRRITDVARQEVSKCASSPGIALPVAAVLFQRWEVRRSHQRGPRIPERFPEGHRADGRISAYGRCLRMERGQ